jgi:hypothetical protein
MSTYFVALFSVILIYDGKQHQHDFEFRGPEARCFSAGGSSTMSGKSLSMSTRIPYKVTEKG